MLEEKLRKADEEAEALRLEQKKIEEEKARIAEAAATQAKQTEEEVSMFFRGRDLMVTYVSVLQRKKAEEAEARAARMAREAEEKRREVSRLKTEVHNCTQTSLCWNTRGILFLCSLLPTLLHTRRDSPT